MDRKDLDVTVVAVVRDLEKAHKALFDEEYLVPRITAPKKRGPSLQIVLGDLVPPASLPKVRKEEEKDWKRRALSAAKFFTNTSVEDYDNLSENSMEENVALEEALQDASVVISCVGAVRPSWDDLLWGGGKRLLFPGKIRKWCNDARHPFYIHYETTRQALHYIEKIQIKRDEVTMAEKADDRFQEDKSSSNNREGDQSQQQNLDKTRRIRFIRISDLMLSRPAWSFVAVWTNLFQSMVFRYQDMTERILQESPHIDTIILRPGDLTDEERVSMLRNTNRVLSSLSFAYFYLCFFFLQDPDITNVQVCESGKLPYPAIVGREDVAALAVAAALFDDTSTKALNIKHNETNAITPFHITLGVRWCGALDPPFSYEQGRQSSGHATSHEGLLHILKKKGNATASDNFLPYRKPNVRRWWQRRRQLKPYVVFTALPLAAMWVWLFSSCFQAIGVDLRKVLLQVVIPSIRHCIAQLARMNRPNKHISF